MVHFAGFVGAEGFSPGVLRDAIAKLGSDRFILCHSKK
jgi:hypothetical protein